MKQKRCREEPCNVCGHYHDVDGGEPCSICGHVMAAHERKQETVMPTAIIPNFLYLGSYDTASRSEILKAMGITHILNTVPTCPCLFRNTFTYHTATTTPPDFQECFQFLDEVKGKEQKVLVYCMACFSRSPSIIIGYLMKHRGWRLAESYKWVKEKRPAINITQADAERLKALEVEMYGSTSVPMGFEAINVTGSLLGITSSTQVPTSTAPVFGVSQQWSFNPAPSAFTFGQAPPAASGTPVFGSASVPQQQNGTDMEM